MLDDREAVLFSPEDITTGLAGLQHWGIAGYDPESARRLVVNGVLSVLSSPLPKAAMRREPKQNATVYEPRLAVQQVP